MTRAARIKERLTIGMVALFLVVSPFFVLVPTADAGDYGLSEAARKAGIPGPPATGELTGADATGRVQSAVGSIVGAALTFVGIIFLLLVIYGGILWMTAAGNEEKVKKAQGMITSAIIGLIIVFAAYVIVNFVLSSIKTAVDPPQTPAAPAAAPAGP